MKEITRCCFASLVHDKYMHYIILIDGNFAEDIYADNNTDAVNQFREWIKERETR